MTSTEQMRALADELGAVVAAQARRIDVLDDRLTKTEAAMVDLLIAAEDRIAALESRLAALETTPVKHSPPRLLDAAD